MLAKRAAGTSLACRPSVEASNGINCGVNQDSSCREDSWVRDCETGQGACGVRIFVRAGSERRPDCAGV